MGRGPFGSRPFRNLHRRPFAGLPADLWSSPATRRRMPAVGILDQIGDTPLVRLERCVPENGAEIWLKLEYRNPTGSMKDRMALAMIEGAEADGLIGPGTTIVEYSGGSTGPALALVCSVKGYRCRIVISDSHTEERIQLMRALGAEVEIVPSVEGRPPRVSAEDIRRMAERAAEIAVLPDHYATLQFTNPYVVPAVRDGLGREIWEQTDGRVTAFVQGVGTAGSLLGVAEALRPHGVRICALEPAGSAAISGGRQGPFATQGWSGMVPPRWDPAWVDEVDRVEDHEAIAMTRRLSREEGIFAGISTGANVVGAIRLAERLGPAAVVVTLAVDTGFKYMSVAPYGQPTYAPGIVGRDRELAAVESFLAAAVVGPQRLLLEGEIGVGRSTLWHAALRGARERGCTVLACRPVQPRIHRSFGSLIELLEPVPLAAFESLPAAQRRALDVALRLRTPAGPPPQPAVIGLAVLGVLRHLARSAPVVVAIDDVPWLDAASAEAIEFALGQVGTHPISAVLTRETNEATRIDVAGYVRVAVEPLSLGALHRLVQDRLEHELPRPQIVRIHRISGGNPFAALELAGARIPLVEADELLGRAGLAALVAARLSALPDAVRAALLELAIGPEAGQGPASRERLGQAPAGVVEAAADGLRFAHPLIASAACELATAERRAEVHEAAAALAGDPERRAGHLARALEERRAAAAERPDASIAAASTATASTAAVAQALELAARHVQRLGARSAFADLAARALCATPGSERPDFVRRALLAAEAHIASGDATGARHLLDPLVTELAPGLERAEARMLLAETNAADDLELAGALAARALLDAGDDQRLRATINLRLAELWHARGDLQRALAHARAARAAAEILGEPRLLLQVLSVLALAETFGSLTVEAGVLELALELERETERPPVGCSPRRALGVRRLFAGELVGARTILEEDAGDAASAGDEVGRILALTQLAAVELRAGRWEAAARCARDATRATAQPVPSHVQASALAIQALVLAHRGAIDEALEVGGRAAATAAAAHAGLAALESAAALGFAELSRMRPTEGSASAHLRSLPEHAARIGVVGAAATRVLADAVEAVIEHGAAHAAEPWIERLEATARDGGSIPDRAVAQRSRGMLLAACGRFDEAEAAFRSALRAHDESDEPFDRARTLLALGTTLRRAKQKRSARDAIDAARATFEELGATTWAERARAEAARIAGRQRHSGGLTPTEARIAELVAEGLSNKEVATALHVTAKTVEGTLSRIYPKLGVRSRSGLAGRLAAGRGAAGRGAPAGD